MVAGVAAGGLVALGGGIHLDLWRDGYRFIPSIGPLFLANAAASAVVAVALAATRRPVVLLAGAAFTLASLVALVVSRTVGLLGFSETWTDASVQVLAAELAALAAIAATAVAARRRQPSPV